MKIETKRLILRPPKISDWKDLVEAINDKDIAAFLATVPHPYKKKDALEFINKVKKDWKKKKPTTIQFSIILKSTNKLIGGSGIGSIDRFSKIAVSGSWIARKYWRKGYITEAKIAFNDFTFNKLKLQKISSKVYADNKASNSMVKKFGYKYEGTSKREIRTKADGKWHDVNLYGLFKEDWKKIRPKLIKKLKTK